CHGVLGEESVVEKDVEAPEGYRHEYGFRLVSPMPRVAYEVKDGGSVGERIGRSGTLIVEVVEEEDEVEEEGEKGGEE
ncbi:hypothetical protein LTS18_013447, partial [Coniosporium uncinatum]